MICITKQSNLGASSHSTASTPCHSNLQLRPRGYSTVATIMPGGGESVALKERRRRKIFLIIFSFSQLISHLNLPLTIHLDDHPVFFSSCLSFPWCFMALILTLFFDPCSCPVMRLLMESALSLDHRFGNSSKLQTSPTIRTSKDCQSPISLFSLPFGLRSSHLVLSLFYSDLVHFADPPVCSLSDVPLQWKLPSCCCSLRGYLRQLWSLLLPIGFQANAVHYHPINGVIAILKDLCERVVSY